MFHHLRDGTLSSALNKVPSDSIDIPAACVYNSPLFAELFDECSPKETEQRVILLPKNTECLIKNEEILKLPGECKT